MNPTTSARLLVRKGLGGGGGGGGGDFPGAHVSKLSTACSPDSRQYYNCVQCAKLSACVLGTRQKQRRVGGNYPVSLLENIKVTQLLRVLWRDRSVQQLRSPLCVALHVGRFTRKSREISGRMQHFSVQQLQGSRPATQNVCAKRLRLSPVPLPSQRVSCAQPYKSMATHLHLGICLRIASRCAQPSCLRFRYVGVSGLAPAD